MCDPISLLGFAVSAASSVMQYQAASAEAAQQNRIYQENAMRANKAAQDEAFAVNQRMLQEQEAAAGQKAEIYREARAARATAAVGAGEANVSGLSVEALLREFNGRAAAQTDRVDQQTEWTLQQLQDQKRQIQATNADRIASVQRAAKPSFFSTGLKIAGTGLNFYNDYQKDKAGK